MQDLEFLATEHKFFKVFCVVGNSETLLNMELDSFVTVSDIGMKSFGDCFVRLTESCSCYS